MRVRTAPPHPGIYRVPPRDETTNLPIRILSQSQTVVKLKPFDIELTELTQAPLLQPLH